MESRCSSASSASNFSRAFVLLGLCWLACAVDDDIVITVTSPTANQHYLTRGMPPGVALSASGSGPEANKLRARPDAYELCVDFDTLSAGYLIECKGFLESTNLRTLDLETVLGDTGTHNFRAFVRPRAELAHEDGVASEADLARFAVDVPYTTGPLLAKEKQQQEHEAKGDNPGGRDVNARSVHGSHGGHDGGYADGHAGVEWVVSFHFSHDAHVAALHWGEPVYVLELERMLAKRYFSAVWGDASGREAVASAWAEAGALVLAATGVKEFDCGVFNMVFNAFGGGAWESVFLDALALAQQNLPSKRWVQVDHHGSHAALGLWDAHRELGFERPLVLSYDGGGNDGLTLAFKGDVWFDQEDESKDGGGGKEREVSASFYPAQALRRLELPNNSGYMNWGNAYASVGAALPEVARKSCPRAHRERGYCNETIDLTHLAEAAEPAEPAESEPAEPAAAGAVADEAPATPLTAPSRLALSGKLMGYAALGVVDPWVVEAVKQEFSGGCPIHFELRNGGGGGGGGADSSAAGAGAGAGAARDRACVEGGYGSGHGPGGQPYLDVPRVLKTAKEMEKRERRKGGGGGGAGSGGDDGDDGDDEEGDDGGGAWRAVMPMVRREDQRIVAASAQAAMEQEIVGLLSRLIDDDTQRYHAALAPEVPAAASSEDAALPHPPSSPSRLSLPFDGIVLVGGCALNVRVNSAVAAAFPSLPVHIPAAPSDCGLAIGSGWLVTQPPRRRPRPEHCSRDKGSGEDGGGGEVSPLNLHLLGPVLFDLEYANDFRGATTTATATDDDATKPQENSTTTTSSKEGVAPLLSEPFLSPSSEAKLKTLGGRQLGLGWDETQNSTQAAAAQTVLAKLLADQQVIGVVRGRSEHGPRALGHRSLLSVPTLGMKERMNALKDREWYRPVAPMVLGEDSDRVFVRDSPHRPLHSPFMSFAPAVTVEAREALPAVTHYDDTARPQTVHPPTMTTSTNTNAANTKAAGLNEKEKKKALVGGAEKGDLGGGGDGWLHGLLAAVKKETGWGVLINTSFNTKGKPILNTLLEALTLLRDCEDLDYVLVEDFLFAKSSASKAVAMLEEKERNALTQ